MLRTAKFTIARTLSILEARYGLFVHKPLIDLRLPCVAVFYLQRVLREMPSVRRIACERAFQPPL